MLSSMQILNETTLELECFDLTSSGEGVCDHEGLKIFVEGALPGEKITCRIVKKKKNYALGELIEILKKSPDRVEPVCPHFKACGGCQVMHLNYDAQLKLKVQRVRTVFKKIADREEINILNVEPCDPALSYRNKIQMPTVWTKDGMKIGLYTKRTHDVIDIKHCYLHNDLGNEVFKQIRSIIKESRIKFYDETKRTGELKHIVLRTSRMQGECLVLLVTAKNISDQLKAACNQIAQIKGVSTVCYGVNTATGNLILPRKTIVLSGPGYLVEKVLGVRVRLSSKSFFQVNIEQAEKMYEAALQFGKIEKGMHVIDAYSGVGVLSSLLAKKGAKVTAIEVVREAVEDSKLNSQENGVKIDAICGKVEEVIAKIDPADVVYVNPPRKGCEKEVLDAISKMEPKRIVYTSCDPATLARDAKYLTELGYDKVELKLFDLFGQTMHIETIACFSK